MNILASYPAWEIVLCLFLCCLAVGLATADTFLIIAAVKRRKLKEQAKQAAKIEQNVEKPEPQSETEPETQEFETLPEPEIAQELEEEPVQEEPEPEIAQELEKGPVQEEIERQEINKTDEEPENQTKDYKEIIVETEEKADTVKSETKKVGENTPVAEPVCAVDDGYNAPLASESAFFTRTVLNYSFTARLSRSDEQTKAQYEELYKDFSTYEKVKFRTSWKHTSVTAGRKTLAKFVFSGSKLCIAFALDPKEYEDTKYRAIDVSDKKRFEKTPMLLKLTSQRRVGYAKDLFEIVAEEYERGADETAPETPPYKEIQTLIDEQLIKVIRTRSRTPVSSDGYLEAAAEDDEEELVLNDDVDEVEEAEETVVTETVEETAAVEEVEEQTEEAEEISEPEEGEAEETLKDDNDEPMPESFYKVRLNGKYAVINAGALAKYFKDGETVNLKEVQKRVKGMRRAKRLKILGCGALYIKLTVVADAVTPKARKTILKAGGQIL